MIPLSFSSQAMTNLIEWRNGVDRDSPHLKDRVELISKVALTQVALVAVAVFSVFEAVFHVCTVFPSISEISRANRTNGENSTDRFLFLVNRKIFLIKSSCFTLGWSVANFFHYNIAHAAISSYSPNLEKSELRLRDAFVDTLKMVRRGRYLDPVDIEAGALFLVDNVLRNESAVVIDDFKTYYNHRLVLAKAVYIFVAGEKREEAVPVFFKRAVRFYINSLRHRLSQQEIVLSFEEFQRYIEDAQNISDANVRNAFKFIDRMASMEMQNSVFCSNCWPRACEILEERENENQINTLQQHIQVLNNIQVN